ncbi:MAG: hypothetical protein LBT79_01315, partial [Elusimicrobiota bacterium]|nr:hypothetical protein [Elusimicrobiota bacterium]
MIAYKFIVYANNRQGITSRIRVLFEGLFKYVGNLDAINDLYSDMWERAFAQGQTNMEKLIEAAAYQRNTKHNFINSMATDKIEEEIGKPTDDFKIVKKKVRKYYENNIQTVIKVDGKDTRVKAPIINNDLKGQGIEFFASGIKETTSNKAYYDKMLLIPFLPYIAKYGKFVGLNETPGRADGIERFYFLQANVLIDREPKVAQIDVGEDRNGRKYYFLTERTNKKASDLATRDKNAGPSNADNNIPNKSTESKYRLD